MRAPGLTRGVAGFAFAVISAASFGASGALAKGLLDAGWSPAAAVFGRILVGGLVVAPFAVRALAGRWNLLRRNSAMVIVYGLVPVAGCQLAYFNAVEHLPVAIALLIEYIAPVAVVGYLWARYGQRPGPLTALGAVVAAVGLVLVLNLVGGAGISAIGVAWALAAMIGAAAYFVMSAHDSPLPPIVLSCGGLLIGALALLVAGLAHLVPFSMSTAPARYPAGTVAWWVPMLGLGVVCAAISYSTGIAAGRRLGSRLASFIALFEVVFSLIFAAALLGEIPTWVQLIGGLLILAGVVLVKLAEPQTSAVGEDPTPVPRDPTPWTR